MANSVVSSSSEGCSRPSNVGTGNSPAAASDADAAVLRSDSKTACSGGGASGAVVSTNIGRAAAGGGSMIVISISSISSGGGVDSIT